MLVILVEFSLKIASFPIEIHYSHYRLSWQSAMMCIIDWLIEREHVDIQKLHAAIRLSFLCNATHYFRHSQFDF